MSNPATSAGNRSLLLVDADTVVGRLVLRTFEEAGWEVTTAGSRDAGLAALKQRRFDRLLINCYPPSIQGLLVLAGRAGTPNEATPSCVLGGPASAEIEEAHRLKAAWVREFSDFKAREDLLQAVGGAGEAE